MRIMMMAAAVAGVLGFAAGQAQAQSLTIAAGQQGSQNYVAGAAIAKLLSEKGDFDVRVQSFGGSGQIMPLIDQGQVDLAPVVAPDVLPAYLGQGPFEGYPMKNLRILTTVTPTLVGIFVREDSDIKTLADLKGKRLTYGLTAQPTLLTNINGILANGGLSPDDIVPVMVPSVPRGVDAFMTGSADAAFFALRGGKAKEADATVGIRWLPLNTDEAARQRMRDVLPTSYVTTIEPTAAIPGLDGPTPVMAYDYTYVVGEHVSDDVVKKILTTLYDNAQTFAEDSGVFKDFTVQGMASDLDPLVYHDASIEFFKAHDMWPPKN